MAKKVTLVCDLNPQHEATETLVVGLDDEFVELDACEADAKKIRADLGKLTGAGRAITVKELSKRGSNGDEIDYAAVRAWCAAQTPPIEVNAKGRLPLEIIEKWRVATK